MHKPSVKRQQIIQSAKKLFLKQGFLATSMDDIATDAQVTKRTVYHHFTDKTELFEAILQEHWNSVNDAATVIKVSKNTEIPQFMLQDFAKRLLTFLYKSDTLDLFRLLIAETGHFPNLCQSLLINGKAPFTRELIEYLKLQNQLGHLAIEDYELAANQFLGLLKEDQFWPKLLGFIKKIDKKRTNLIIDNAVNVFLKFYSV